MERDELNLEMAIALWAEIFGNLSWIDKIREIGYINIEGNQIYPLGVKGPSPAERAGGQMAAFDKARKAFPGTKRGLAPEYDAFKKAHKGNVPLIIPLLGPAIEARKQWMTDAPESVFVPSWPNFKTWLHQHRWTDELPTHPSKRPVYVPEDTVYGHYLALLQGEPFRTGIFDKNLAMTQEQLGEWLAETGPFLNLSVLFSPQAKKANFRAWHDDFATTPDFLRRFLTPYNYITHKIKMLK